MKKTFIKLTSLVLTGSTLLAAPLNLNKAQAQEDDVIATIGDYTINKEDFYQAMKETYGNSTLRTIILEKILENNAEDPEGLKKSAEEEIQTQIDEIGDEEVFNQFLASQNLGSSQNYTHQVYVRNLLQNVIEQHIDTSDEAIKKFYDEDYQPLMQAQHILVDEEDLAKELIQKINDGEDFDALAKEYSKDGSAENGGLLDPFSTGQMVTEFEDAVKGQANGEVTQEPVKSQYGYHVIKTIDNGEKKPLDEVKEDVTLQYKQSKFEDTEFVYSVVGQLTVDAGVEIKDADLTESIQDLINFANKKDEKTEEDNQEENQENTEEVDQAEEGENTEEKSE